MKFNFSIGTKCNGYGYRRGALIAFCLIVCAVRTAPILCGEAEKKDKDDAESFLKSVTVPKGSEAHLFSDKQIVNPTAICFDDKNRVYVAETMRFRVGGGIDNRAVMFLYFDDIKGTTLADRSALYEKYKDKFPKEYFTKYADRVSVLEDTTGSGRADKATVFADGFNHPLDGPASGISYRDGKIHLACVPKIWELPDANGDLVADKKDVLFEGFGIRVSISGHDVHGLIWGPDGKLYWSMGDRGYNVKSREGQQYISPGSGGVFRCNADGSELELYYAGLRNPEELAFDEWGNLFTVDNNADIGDQSRLVYILEGGTNGWDMGWQMLGYGNFAQFAGLNGRQSNPWMLEGLYKTRFDDQPTWILPPVAHITNGPCGFAYNPGVVALNDSYAQNFFVADYTAGNNSGVHAFKAEEDGAGFKMTHAHKFAWGVTVTDVAFGYDGKMYIADYMGGWHEAIRSKGRIITVFDTDEMKKPGPAGVKKIFADGFSKRSVEELSEMLKHADMRVRTRAQWELAAHGKDGLKALSTAASGGDNLLARVHGIWGLAQIGRQDPQAITTLIGLLGDKEARVREQAAKRLGDLRCIEAGEKLVPLLKDASLRVRTFAAITLGKIKHRAAVPALAEMIKENDDKDVYVRHAGIMGLAGCGEVAALQPFITDSSRALRLAVLLAYRRLKEPAISAFLKDSDALIYAETIRAIYDLPITGAMPQLAAELKRHFDAEKGPAKGKMTQLLYLRLLNANGRYGVPENAAILADFAAKAKAPEDIRIQALAQLEKWEQPTDVDPMVGQYRPVPRRDKALIKEAMKSAIEFILANEKDALLVKAATIAASVGISLPEKMLWANLENAQALEALRVESLRQLVEKKDERLKGSIPKLLNDANENLRLAALDAFIQLDPEAGIKSAGDILNGKAVVKDAVQIFTERTEKAWPDMKTKGPAKDDYADVSSSKGATFSYVKNFAKPHEKAGASGEHLPRLNDGIAAENNDDVDRTSWLDGGEARILLDLQKPIEIARVNTYSWHRENRAPQNFFLWGSASDKPDAAAKDPGAKGWTRIAAVDTIPLKDGGKHCSAIFNPGGIVGNYRWLMWQNPHRSIGTFFTEIDVYEKGQTLPPLELAPPDQRIKQQVLLSLGKTKDGAAAAIVENWMERMGKGEVPANLQFDLMEAAAMRTEDGIKSKVAQYQNGLNKDDKLAQYRIGLEGGDATKGRDIYENSGAQCLRCHKIADEKGGDAGPNLAGIGKRLTREKLLESLIDPNAVVVPGFGLGNFKMNDGTLVSGSVFGENDKEITLKLADNNIQTIKVADIKKRIPATSPMPPMETVLKPREIRDLISFLATQQTEYVPPPKTDDKH